MLLRIVAPRTLCILEILQWNRQKHDNQIHGNFFERTEKKFDVLGQSEYSRNRSHGGVKTKTSVSAQLSF
jgi:hypothetical protein